MVMDKCKALKKLEEEIENNKGLPLLEANLVFGEGNADCKILFIGEAPGKKEDELRRPFVGRSGKLLEKTLCGIGISRDDVYITNIIKRRPPENRDPSKSEITAYTPYLIRQIDIIKPTVIATLGRFSMNYFLPDATISIDQGHVFKAGEYFVYPIYHPAAAMRNKKTMAEFKNSFKKLQLAIKKCEGLNK